jgi:hypothetical protein
MLTSAADDNRDETTLAVMYRSGVLVENNARSDRLTIEVPGSHGRCNLEVPMSNSALHLESSGEWLQFDESNFACRELDLY